MCPKFTKRNILQFMTTFKKFGFEEETCSVTKLFKAFLEIRNDNDATFSDIK